MLAQGTRTRSASDIASGFSSLGAIFDSENVKWDSNELRMQSTVRGLDKALDHYFDIAMNASFPDAELRATQEQVANSIRQRRPNATGLGGVAFDKLLYGDQPYGRQLSGDEKTVRAITRDDVLNFYNSYYRPNNSTLIIIGDVHLPDIKIRLEKAFAGWKPGNAAAAKLPDQQMISKPGIYLIDKPGAVQSSIKIGAVGVERANLDFDAIEVMNSILGQRLGRNLRQVHGYSYRLFSSFDYREKGGPFSAWGEVQIVSTKEAVQEFINEINGIRGDHPITSAELQARKKVLIQLLPRDFETVGGTAARLADLATFSLSDDYYNSAIPRINAVTAEDVYRVANKYLDTSKMIVVIVGDLSIIEPKIRELGMPVTIVNSDGNPIAH
jgi:zinc protease